MPTGKRGSTYRAAFHVRKGNFHKWLRKKPDSPITAADIAKGAELWFWEVRWFRV